MALNFLDTNNIIAMLGLHRWTLRKFPIEFHAKHTHTPDIRTATRESC